MFNNDNQLSSSVHEKEVLLCRIHLMDAVYDFHYKFTIILFTFKIDNTMLVNK